MKCSNCGADNPNNSSFCSSCGSSLESSDFDVLDGVDTKQDGTVESEDPFSNMSFGSTGANQGGMQQGFSNQDSQSQDVFSNMSFGSSEPNIKKPSNCGVGFLVVLKVFGKLVKFAIPITIIVAIVWFFNFAKSVEESKEAYEEATGIEYDDSDDGYWYDDATTDTATQYVSVGETLTIYNDIETGEEIGKVTVTYVDLMPELRPDGSIKTILKVNYDVETTAQYTLFYGLSYFNAYDEEGNYLFGDESYAEDPALVESDYLYKGETPDMVSGVLYFELEDDTKVVDLQYWDGTDYVWRINVDEIM